MWPRNLSRLGVWTFVSLATAGGLLATYPGGAAALLRDVWDYRANARTVEVGTTQKRQIDLAASAVRERTALKHELCDQLLRGEVGLATAAGTYLGLLESDPNLLAPFRRTTPGETDEERAAANLIRVALDNPNATGTERQTMLANFRSLYGVDYPFPTPVSSQRNFDPAP